MATALRPVPDPAVPEVDAWLLAYARKSLLRFITCGSVDDGKSTLIGRLLYDSKMLFEDQRAALESAVSKSGALDFASLVDGLSAEREQGITIDVAYRFFATERRKFVVADTPGHEQYTRNMVTGASTAEAAVILVDARKGVLTQTRRHSQIAHLLGIGNLVLAVNKMDLVGYDQDRFEAILADYRAFAAEVGIERFVAIPVSGLEGDNVTARSGKMDWYRGPALLEHLEQIPVRTASAAGEPFRMSVQWVNRAGRESRLYAGTIAAGRIRPGDRVSILPSGRETRVARIVSFDGDLDQAGAGQAVTLALADEVDCSRGDMIAGDGPGLAIADRLDANLVWMAAEPLVPGRAYWLKLGALTVSASVSRVATVRDAGTMAEGPGRPLGLNDIGRCELVLDRPIPAALYHDNRRLGGFILIDRASHATLAAGLIHGLPESEGTRAALEAGQGRIIWLTGSSPEERARFARKARERFAARGRTGFVLDDASLGDGLSSDLGTSEADRAESRRRAIEVAKLLSRAGVTVLVALDAPEGGERPGTELDVRGAAQDWDWII